jgi:hypothetical protein
MYFPRAGSAARVKQADQIREHSPGLRLVGTMLAALLGLLAIGSWHAPGAEARKKRNRTPTTVLGESVSTTTNPLASVKSAADTRPSTSKPAKSGSGLVFPGAGKRENAPSTIAAKSVSKTKPTLLASPNPGGSNGKAKPANSNRSDPRLRAIGFRSRTKLVQHYEKHGREFGNISQDQYLSMAQDLRDAPLSKRVVEANQLGGTISRFDRQTGAFTAFDRDLTIRTFFKPNGGEDYFRRAATKTH